MPRPSLIIGIGGTGSWVLSWLKKDLIETHGSLENRPVRLLLLDTANILADAGGGNGQRQAVAGQEGGEYSEFIRIDPDNEYIRLPSSGDSQHTKRIDQEVARLQRSNMSPQEREQYRQTYGHLARWFWGNYFPPPALDLHHGAAKFRQLGRLSLLQGLHIDGAADTVYSTLQNLLDQIVRPGNHASVDVHIAGSFAGGTGSGIFLDLAMLMRKIARDSQIDLFLTGFFAMPQVFSPIPTSGMRTKAFSAWRELNRMMSIQRDQNVFRMAWGTSQQTVCNVEQPVYDHIYLIDSAPQTGQTDHDPSKTVFPIMAEAISFFLDKYSGERYVQHIRTNLAELRQQAEFRGKPVYSTFYVKSWKLPVHHYRSVARHEFAKRFLERLLGVDADTPSATRRGFRLRPVQNAFQRASEIFAGSLDDNDVGTTRFVELQDQIRTIAEAERPNKANEWARYTHDLLDLYAEMPETPEGIQIKARLLPYINYGVPPVTISNDNHEMRDHVQRIRNDLYGVNNTGGSYLELYGDFRGQQIKGEMYSALEVVHQFQMDTLKRRLQTWIARELNSGEGALATVRSTLEYLLDGLEANIDFLNMVQERLDIPGDAAASANSAHTIAMTKTASNSLIERQKNVIGADGGKKAVGNWHAVEQEYQALQRNHRALERMQNTVKEMYEYVRGIALPKVLEMEQQLVTDSNVDRITGLYRLVLESLRDQIDLLGYDERVTVVLDGAQEAFRPDDQEIEKLLERTTWFIDDSMNLRIEIRVSDRRNPIVLESNMNDSQQTVRLVRRLLDDVADRVIFADSGQTALDALGIDSLGRQLDECNQTLFQPSILGRGHRAVRTFYVRCARHRTQDNADGHLSPDEENAILNRLPGDLPRVAPHAVEIVGSENPYKIMVFSAREVLLPEAFAEWETCRNHYQQQVIGDPANHIVSQYESIRADHIFAAEQNALMLEKQHYEAYPGVDFPILNYRVVHLLEDNENLHDFLFMWGMDWVRAAQIERNKISTIAPPEPEPETLLCPLSGNDWLTIIARYTTVGNDFHNRPINYERLASLFNKALDNVWLASDETSSELMRRFQYEAQMAKELAGVVEEQLRLHGRHDDIKRALDHCLAPIKQQAEEGEVYYSTLAEAIAYDFTRVMDGGESLVLNHEAHLQMLKIVLVGKFTALAQEVKNHRINQGWN